jgi:hypothetical protein
MAIRELSLTEINSVSVAGGLSRFVFPDPIPCPFPFPFPFPSESIKPPIGDPIIGPRPPVI